MGLFDGFKKKSTLDFSSNIEAIATLMVAIGSLDGDLDDEEISTVVAIANINPGMSTELIDESFSFSSKYILANGAEQSAVDAFNFLPDALHGTAFSYACMVALADGVVTAEEEETLIELAGLSSLDEDDTSKIIAACSAIMTPIA